jgi:hypothetical protein
MRSDKLRTLLVRCGKFQIGVPMLPISRQTTIPMLEAAKNKSDIRFFANDATSFRIRFDCLSGS